MSFIFTVDSGSYNWSVFVCLLFVCAFY